MKIGVISDTHLSRINDHLEKAVQNYFEDVELILHAGDLTSLEVLDAFKGKTVVAVAGNMDSDMVKRKLPQKEIVEVGDFRIGLIHGWGSPNGLEKKVADNFQDVHCIIFGHSHQPFNQISDRVLLFNPGAFSSSPFFRGRRSIGLLNIGESIRGEIIKIE